MDPITGAALIGGAASLAGSALNFAEQKSTQDTEIDLANSAHQREVADLKAAGLNPILSVNKGASTPGLSAPQVDASAIGKSAMDIAQLDLIKSQTANSNAQAAKTVEDQRSVKFANDMNWQNMESDLQLKKAAVVNSGLDIDTKKLALKQLDAQINNLHSQGKALQYTLPGLYNEAKFQQGLGGKISPYMDRFLRYGNSAAEIERFMHP